MKTITADVLKKKFNEVVFGTIVKGEKIVPPKFKTTYPSKKFKDEFEWMQEMRVSSRSHRNPVYF
jgi:hypothetical protein